MLNGVVAHGHLSPADWNELLWSSKFLVGTGDPLLGPSAVDAVAAGCMFINPQYDRPKRKVYHSQHPFLEGKGHPYACSYKENDATQLADCVTKALRTTFEPWVPPEFRRAAYLRRVATIFKRHLP